MKRLSNSASASLGAFMSIVSNSTEHDTMGDNDSDNSMYVRPEYQQPAMMGGGYEEDPFMEQDSSGLGGSSEKKRRLSVDQVKALEKNFEVENKLEPERKVRLAQELGLQPRQVAVWFQNRRARWKTKQLERDYGMLKASYDGLKLNFDKLQHDNEALVKQIQELRSKVNEDGPNGDSHSKQSGDKEDELMSYSEEKSKKLQTTLTPKPDKDSESENINSDKNGAMIILGSGDLKDGSSDSDNSSTILNDDNINSNRHCSSPRQHQFLEIDIDRNNTNFQFQEPGKAVFAHQSHHQQPQQYVKLVEHNFLGEDPCSTFFSDDQPPSLHWYEWS